MATKIDLDRVMQPADAALNRMDQALAQAAARMDDSAHLPAGMKDGMKAFIDAGKAHVDGARQMKQELVGYAKARIDANIDAAKASMAATSLDDALAIQRRHMIATLNADLAQSGKVAELALAISEQTVAPLKKPIDAAPWNAWLKTAA